MAENLFLRKQLALFKERKARPRPASPMTRLAMIALARFFDWRDALVIVKPETFIKWHRTAFRMFWRWKSRKRGRPALPRNLRELIRQMDRENPTWGEERIANELFLKLGTAVSARTVREYLDSHGRAWDHRQPALVDLRAKSCPCCRRLRFLDLGHCFNANPIRFRGDGGRFPADSAYQRYRPPDGE